MATYISGRDDFVAANEPAPSHQPRNAPDRLKSFPYTYSDWASTRWLFLEIPDVRKVLLVSPRLAGITVVIIGLFSACSSQPSGNTRASRRVASPALSANQEAGLARRTKAKDDALLFVGLAQNACRELTRKTEALTRDSTVDSSELNSFIPPELYPTDSFAAYVGDATFAEVKSQLTQLVSSLVELLRSLERKPGDLVKDRSAFQQQKLKTVVSATMYCESVRRAGASVGTLH
jgi:hypothetical protein